MMKWWLLGGALVLGALRVPASQDSSGQPIRIGLCAQAGPGASFVDVAALCGATLAIDLGNERGGLLGRRIELVPAGGSGSAKEARAGVGELLAHGVAGVVAPLSAEGRELVVQGCKRQGLPVVATVETPEVEARALVDALVGSFRCTRIGLLADAAPRAKALQEELEARLTHPFQLVLREGIAVKGKALEKALQEQLMNVNEGAGIDPEDAHFSAGALANLRKNPGVVP